MLRQQEVCQPLQQGDSIGAGGDLTPPAPLSGAERRETCHDVAFL
jgi:hypothetical protein